MENMISIPESRYMELLEIEKKYNSDSDIREVFSKNSLSAIYIELNSVVQAGLNMDDMGYNNDDIWCLVYNKVFGKNKISGKWRNLVPDFSWYDPDASYYDDVMAFYDAVQDYCELHKII
jgi:hypothetical protein